MLGAQKPEVAGKKLSDHISESELRRSERRFIVIGTVINSEMIILSYSHIKSYLQRQKDLKYQLDPVGFEGCPFDGR